MIKLSNVEVFFDRPVAIYCVGDLVSGRIVVDLKRGIKIKGIYVKLVGKAEVNWIETIENARGNNSNHKYSDKEKYFDVTLDLFEGGNLSAGSHEFPFTYQLPLNIPASYETKYGSVSYWCKVKIVRPWQFDVTRKTSFNVSRPLDLNLDPLYKIPEEGHKHKILGQNSWISCNVKMDRRGYAPGENIILHVQIDNQSRKNIGYVRAALRQVVQVSAKSSIKDWTTNVEKVYKGGIPRSDNQILKDIRIPVPDNIPSSGLDGCNIINVVYEIEVKLESSGLMTICLPVTIGTIPLAKMFNNRHLSVSRTCSRSTSCASLLEMCAKATETDGFLTPPSSFPHNTSIMIKT